MRLQIMLKKKISIIFIISMFLYSALFIVPHDKIYKVIEVKSPIEFEFNNRKFFIKDLDSFDSKFTEKNKSLAKDLGITELEAFILGNLAKYWAENLMKGRNVVVKDDDDLIYIKYSYRTKYLYSGYCIKDSHPYNKEAFEKRLKEIRRVKFKVIDLNTERVYDIEDKEIRNLKNFILIRKNHLGYYNDTVFYICWIFW